MILSLKFTSKIKVDSNKKEICKNASQESTAQGQLVKTTQLRNSPSNR